MADASDMISRGPFVDHHMHVPEVRVPTQQPRDPDEEWGLTGTQR
jgi:hypothetical protein